MRVLGHTFTLAFAAALALLTGCLGTGFDTRTGYNMCSRMIGNDCLPHWCTGMRPCVIYTTPSSANCSATTNVTFHFWALPDQVTASSIPAAVTPSQRPLRRDNPQVGWSGAGAYYPGAAAVATSGNYYSVNVPNIGVNYIGPAPGTYVVGMEYIDASAATTNMDSETPFVCQ
jgi:hypothetical protein